MVCLFITYAYFHTVYSILKYIFGYTEIIFLVLFLVGNFTALYFHSAVVLYCMSEPVSLGAETCERLMLPCVLQY